MKLQLGIILLLLISITSCSTQKHTSGSNQVTSTSSAEGSSYENAVVINEKTETAGVNAEYAWVKKHYPSYQMVSQSLNHKDKKSYDIINIKTAKGEAKAIYFDISNFFGKF